MDYQKTLRRAAKRFRCRDCGQLIRAKWNLKLGQRTVEEHEKGDGTFHPLCPRSGRLVEIALLGDRDGLTQAAWSYPWRTILDDPKDTILNR